MNKIHYSLILVLVGGAILITSFIGEPQSTPDSPQASSPPLTAVAAEKNEQETGRFNLDVSFKDITDTSRSLSEWKGKILVLNFWATWCAPCRHEIPELNAVQKKYADRNVEIIGLAYDDKAAIKRFTSIIPIDYQVLVGDEEVIELSMTYGNVMSILPYTIFIDTEGRIFDIKEGALTQAATERILAKVL